MNNIINLRNDLINILSKQIIDIINPVLLKKEYIHIDIYTTLLDILYFASFSYENEDILKKYIFENNNTKHNESCWEEILLEYYKYEIFYLFFIKYNLLELTIKQLIKSLQKYNYVVYTENMMFKDNVVKEGVIIVTKNKNYIINKIN